jgi:uridine kinase
MAPKPQLVGIIGGSGAGKSWLAGQLRQRLGKETGRISLDDFYVDRSHLAPSRRNKINFDHPRSIDWELVSSVLKDCLAGRAARLPKYDFSSHSRLPDREVCKPKALLLMDGLWLLHSAAMRRQFALTIFLDCSECDRLQRRLLRDTADRGRSEASVREQFASQVAPMHARYVQPQARWADIVLTETPDLAAVDRLADRIRNLLIS